MSNPVTTASWPDDSLTYSALPASGDDGFPQVCLLQIQQIVYRLTLGIYYPDPALILSSVYANQVFDLPDPTLGLYLNLRLEREDLPPATRLIGARRVVRNMPVALGSLRFRFQRVRVAQANLTSPGSYGSSIIADVAVANV